MNRFGIVLMRGSFAASVCVPVAAYADPDDQIEIVEIDRSTRSIGSVSLYELSSSEGSPFAIEFAKQINQRQSLNQMFCKTAIAVTKRRQDRQSPWRQGDLAFNGLVSGMRALPIP